MAGLVFAFSDIAVLLFKVKTAVHLKLKDSTAPTSALYSWKSFAEAVEPAPLKADNFSRVKKQGLPGDNTKIVPHKIKKSKISSAGKFPLKSEDVQSPYKINPQAVFFKGIDLHDYDINNKDSSDTDTSSETKENKFPEPLTSFNPEGINFPEDEIKAEGELWYQNYKETYSQNDYNTLYEKTKEQSLHPIWMFHRAGQITASIAGEVYKTNVDITSQSLIKQNNTMHRSWKKQIHKVWYKYRAISPRILQKHSKA